CRERRRLARVGGGRPRRRQLPEGAHRAALLVDEDERARRPRRIAVPALDDDAADPRWSGKPRDDDERRLLPRRQVGDGGLCGGGERDDGVDEEGGPRAAPRLSAVADRSW